MQYGDLVIIGLSLEMETFYRNGKSKIEKKLISKRQN